MIFTEIKSCKIIDSIRDVINANISEGKIRVYALNIRKYFTITTKHLNGVYEDEI